MQILFFICMHQWVNKSKKRVKWFSFSFPLTGQEEERRGGLNKKARVLRICQMAAMSKESEGEKKD